VSGTAALLRRILETADLPFDQAVALPGEAFHSPELFALERERLLGGEWLALAHVSQIPEPGDLVSADLLGEPVVVVRGADREVRTLSRVCQHRGMDILEGDDGAGGRKILRCPYHLWAYELDGRLRSAPDMKSRPGFDAACVALPSFQTEVFEGFVFATRDGGGPSVAERFGPLRDRFLAPWRMGEAKVVWQKRWESRFNWKLLVENFMEPYHHQGSHLKTLEPLMPARGCRTEGADEFSSAVRLPLKPEIQRKISETGPLPGFAPFPGMSLEDHGAWWVFLGYPTFLLFAAADRFYWYRLLPTGPDFCDLTTTMLVHPAALAAPDYEQWLASESEGLCRIHGEDVLALEGMQRGVRSRAYAQGRLAALEEPIWHFQRYLARRIRATGGTVPRSVEEGDEIADGRTLQGA
jgi:phenylpropionate dioxygenase-like ring-hydroxylating dioxygenase large terminal subunit